ncbi:hypothetical protein [Treponema sp.]|uniref:hypothetical protein n=1 Tax=Treponema sp. TaxID=166 RepID=UPI003F090B7D
MEVSDMKTVYGTAFMPGGLCGFGYVDEGLPKEQALEKLKLEMQNNQAFQYFLSTLPVEKRYSVVKEIVDAVIGSNADQKLDGNKKKSIAN